MAITEPGMWDAGVAQQAVELPCWAGLAATVGKDLVNAIGAVTDAVTRAEAACGWWALPILGARLHLALLLITAIRAVLVTITTPDEGHIVASDAALEACGWARTWAGAYGLGGGPARGGLQAQPEAKQQPQSQAQSCGLVRSSGCHPTAQRANPARDWRHAVWA